ncbi:ATP-binding protein [Sinorhizobium meliloti]|uniref:ATP-binding protein n=1 Tax=Rhizobium meliloti TaxID=382 RepID=UPI000FD19DC4|nr:ATP-binding protein [Sinorhizobium meliloti]RVJ46110.1 ATP-binding protein [Sinorhizobium meliloti]RVJ80885.1 ATP-binding protein [Sinorhizobium meliloti]RVJ98932.1 ATP-binding protein [Sinorhizobium meliloti]
MTDERILQRAFKPRARLLQLLGDQLIGSPRLALFELVKNAYDADASEVTITFTNLGTPDAAISIKDDGQGMSLDVIENIWLVPGDDHRQRERGSAVRSPRFKRLPLGEKGVGRFAVHKLGESIRLVTRAEGQPECVAEFDWDRLLEETYLSDAEITVRERKPEVFSSSTGTLIEVTRLRSEDWTRGTIRDLYRQVTSIASPFGDRGGNFEVKLEVPEHPEWLATLPGLRQLLEMAPYRFEFDFDGSRLHYRYEFVGVPGVKLEGRVAEREEIHFQIPPADEPDDLDPVDEPRPKRRARITADLSTLEGIGKVSGKFHIFDRDKKVLANYGDTRFLERFLNQNGGVRVYRDGVRVYNYGEPSDDWLGLDLRRVNEPAKRLSRNITIGVVDLGLAESPGLQEKTNREGFVETAAYERLRRVVLGALWILQVERNIDKERIREVTGGASDVPQGLAGPLTELRRLARENKVGDVLEPTIRRIEEDYQTLRENFARSGVSHAGLAIIFHEVERGVRVLTGSINDPSMTIESLRDQAGQLQGVLETSSQLLRNTTTKPGSLRDMVRTARDLSLLRFRLHGIKLECPALEEKGPDATATFASGLVLGALTNLIDNAVHWVKVRHPEPGERRIYVNVIPDYEGGPAIVVADNGTGFLDDPATMVSPFFTRRPGGSGLGLYFANLVMDLNEGRLVFPTMDQAEVPDGYDGAVAALVFGRV